MKNVFKYYYNLETEVIHQNNYNYRSRINGIEYCLQKIENIDNDLLKLYSLNNYLLKNSFPCHQIVLNIKNDILTFVNGEPYVLLKIFVINRDININDIKDFYKLHIDNMEYNNLDKSDWYNLWTKKIDYIEYQVSQIGKKFPIIRKSINYYIGLAENSISLVSDLNHKSLDLVVSHRRINKKTKTYDLYNPLNFIIDSRVRDLTEFYKERFFADNIDFEQLQISILECNLTLAEAIAFFSRMLFPTYYFDCYQDILFGNCEETELLKYINKTRDYQFFLSKIYFFLKMHYNLPEIEWITKS